MAAMQLWKISRRQAQQQPMHFHAEDEIFHILEGTVTFSIDGDVFNASVGSMWLFQQAHITRGGIRFELLRSACRPSFHQVE